jgi:hypothetical protein
MLRSRVIAVDFDGTMVRHMYPQIGKEADDAVRVLKRVQDAGHKITLWTCRESDPEDPDHDRLKEAVEWMYESGIQLCTVNDTPSFNEFRNSAGNRRKIVADCYVDDRNIGIPKKFGCVDWSWVEKQLEKAGWFDG